MEDTRHSQNLEERTMLAPVGKDLAGAAYVVWMTAVFPPTPFILLGELLYKNYQHLKTNYDKMRPAYS